MVYELKTLVNQKKENYSQGEGLRHCNLLIIQVGNNAASNRYVNGKINDLTELRGKFTLLKGSDSFDFYVAVKEFIRANKSMYHGIILQSPAFSCNLWNEEIIDLISSIQDVDGFKRDSAHLPCTPAACLFILQDYFRNTYGIESFEKNSWLKGKVIAVVGKGAMVGKPLVPMLMDAGATVMSLNSATPNLRDFTVAADIVISAVGKANLITADMVKPGAFVIDVGITQDEEGKMCGDVSKELYDMEGVQVTPVPGGVGLVTRLMLMKNLKEAYKMFKDMPTKDNR